MHTVFRTDRINWSLVSNETLNSLYENVTMALCEADHSDLEGADNMDGYFSNYEFPEEADPMFSSALNREYAFRRIRELAIACSLHGNYDEYVRSEGPGDADGDCYLDGIVAFHSCMLFLHIKFPAKINKTIQESEDYLKFIQCLK